MVADASWRTTTLNAYVSGFGTMRRLVVHDNLAESTRSTCPDADGLGDDGRERRPERRQQAGRDARGRGRTEATGDPVAFVEM